MSVPDEFRTDPSLTALGLEILGVLGEGGSAIVFRASDARHGREVAVKILRQAVGMENAAARFEQEIRVAAGLRHPNILPLFGSGTLRDGRSFAVMPVAQGRTLRDLLDDGPLPIADALRYSRELAQALAYLHSRGFVHRDVKPENVIVESGHAVLTDFGLAVSITTLSHPVTSDPSARRAEVTDGGNPRFTRAGHVVGTLAYMSPEAIFADAPIDARTDLFSLGVLIFELLVGRLSVATMPPERVMEARAHAEPLHPRARRAEVPLALDLLVSRLTTRDVGGRPPSADAVDAELADLIAAGGTGARRSPWRVALVALVAVAAIVAATVRWGPRANPVDETVALDPRRVVVADLANDTSEPALEGLGSLAGEVITGALSSGTTLTVVNAAVAAPSRQQRGLPASDSSLAEETRAIVQEARAGLVVTGAYFAVGDGLELSAELTDTRSGRILGTAGPIRAPRSSPDAAMRILADSVVSLVVRTKPTP